MAKLWITEYADMAYDGNGEVIYAGEEPHLADQVVDYTAGSTQSAALNTATRYVRLVSDAACHIAKFGVTPATTNHPRFPANAPEFAAIDPSLVGTGLRIAVVAGA